MLAPPAPAVCAEARTGIAVPALLLGLALVARLPFLFTSVIDWDESTFIIVGQSWADGHLPYTELWDLKGPLLFAPFALTISLFGPSIVAIRLMGVLFVGLTAVATYHLFHRLLGPAGSFAGAAFTILAITIAPSGQVVMSEVIAILPLTCAALAVAEGGRRPLPGLVAGLCVSLATLVRPNLGLCALTLGAFGVLMARGGSGRVRATWALAYVAGGLVPVLLIGAMYGADGHLPLLARSVLGPALAYATTNLTAGEVGGALTRGMLDLLSEPRHLAYLLVAIALLVAFARLLHCWRRLDGRQRELVLLTIALALTVMASILIGGQAWLHYLIQVLPFSCPLIGIALAPTLRPATIPPRLLRAATLVLLLVAFVPIVRAYAGLASDLQTHGTPFTDPGHRTVAFLEHRLHADDRVLFLTHHIAGWLLGRPPIDRIVHPSNLAREEHVPVPGKLEALLETRPRFVVFSENRRVLANEPRIREALGSALERDYREVARFDDVTIFERATARKPARAGT